MKNLNQQSDSADLLGGFKPVELRVLCAPLKKKFEELFPKTFSKKANQKFLDSVQLYFANKEWKKFILLLQKVVRLVEDKIQQSESPNKRAKKGLKPHLKRVH